MGSEEQKQHYLPRILSGEDTWCQGYSEPNAGSDLGNVGLKAELDGDQWVLNGQKIWTSAGHLADHIFTLARTDPDAPKHKGISFLLVDMRQPGIEVRPIKMISGESEFNEVFYTDATVPEGERRRWCQRRLAHRHGAARLRARRGGGHPVGASSRARSIACSCSRRSGASPTTPGSGSVSHGAYSKVQIMRYNGMRVLTQFLQRPPSRPRRRDLASSTGASTTRSSPSSPIDIYGADGHDDRGPRADSSAFGPPTTPVRPELHRPRG